MTEPPSTTRLQRFAYLIARALSTFVIRVIFRGTAFHPERMPLSGPLLVVANHQSYLDPPLIGVFVGRTLNYIAKAELFKSKLLGWIFTSCNALPIREGAGDLGAIRETIRRLEEQRAILIFPEGTRSGDGAMHPFKRGAALLLKKAPCPVLPVAVEGCFDAWPRGGRPHLFGPRLAVMYGYPIPHDELMKDGADAALARLAREIDAMRLTLRAKLREQSRGRFPAPGPGDNVLQGGVNEGGPIHGRAGVPARRPSTETTQS